MSDVYEQSLMCEIKEDYGSVQQIMPLFNVYLYLVGLFLPMLLWTVNFC